MICFIIKENFNTTYNFTYLSKYFEEDEGSNVTKKVNETEI